MKKKIFLILALATCFGFGFAFKSVLNNTPDKQKDMKRVTGIGGIFFKCKDPEKIKQWYQTHLGMTMDPYGAKFDWRENADSTKIRIYHLEPIF